MDMINMKTFEERDYMDAFKFYKYSSIVLYLCWIL